MYVGNNISQTNHFAEGCTRPGFDTWLCLQNPGGETAAVTINYYARCGAGRSRRTHLLACRAHSRTHHLVNGGWEPGKDVSIQVTSSKPIVSERPMYFNYAGRRPGRGATTPGAPPPPRGVALRRGLHPPVSTPGSACRTPGAQGAVKVEYMMENGASLQRTG